MKKYESVDLEDLRRTVNMIETLMDHIQHLS